MLADALIARVDALLARRGRVILGIAGCPGAGKSTLAIQVTEHFASVGVPSVWVPMDGYHLADAELDRLGRRRYKGAIDTFDAFGYLSMLRRVAEEATNTVYAPAFDRTIEEPIAGSVPVVPGTRLVVTEGNYLLDDSVPWSDARGILSETWFVDVDDHLRRERLTRRHILFGKTPDDARDWVLTVDEPNAERIKRTRSNADLIVDPGTTDALTTTHHAQGDS